MPEKFGHIVTCDHVYAHSEELEGITGDRDLLVVFDLGTKCIAAYPVKNKSTDETTKRLAHFRGKDSIRYFFSDKHASLISAVERLGQATIPHELSTPGIHQTNAIIESKVKNIVKGTRCNLRAAGLPACFWPLAAEHYAFLCTVHEDQLEPAYYQRHGRHFKGPLIPFGCLIDAIPSPLAQQPRKFNPRGVPSVFLGYVVQPGQKWKGEYRWAELADFSKVSLFRDVRAGQCKVRIHIGRDVIINSRIKQGEHYYPLVEQYLIENRTLKGIRMAKAKQKEDDDYEDPPPPDPEPEQQDDEEKDNQEETLEDFLNDEGVRTPHLTDSDTSVHIDDDDDDNKKKPADSDTKTKTATGKKSMYEDYDRNYEPRMHSKDKYGYPLDEYGQRIRKTNRPPYIPSAEWFSMSKEKKAEAKAQYLEQRDAWRALDQGRTTTTEDLGNNGKRSLEDSSIVVRTRETDGSKELKGAASSSGCGVPLEDRGGGPAAPAQGSESPSDAKKTYLKSSLGATGLDTDKITAMLEQQLPPEDLERLKHRDKIPLSPVAYYACVARDVPPSQRSLPGPKAALEKEWQRLREVGCWDDGDPQEFHTLSTRYHREGRIAHFGRIFEICVEKNSHLPEGDPARKYKGRVVYQGNNVTDQYGRAAIFEELSSCPATMAASKACDLVACLPQNDGQQSDATMAYTQAPFKGTETWVIIPRHQWPKPGSQHYDKWYWPDGTQRFKTPCNRMLRALYGHPQSGGWWEQHADAIARERGFVPIPNWRGCYFHAELHIFLIIYVDDFKMAGPRAVLPHAWTLLREVIDMDDPTPFGLFLGCKHTITTTTVPTAPRPVKMIEYDVEGYLAKAVEDYKQGTGNKTLQSRPTPFINTTSADDVSTPYATGDWCECPWCRGRFLASDFGQGKGNSVTKPTAKLLPEGSEAEPVTGLMGDLAMSILMKVMYAARYARHDLLCAVARLAQRIHKWSPQCDTSLHRLMGYIQATLHYRQIGWVGDELADIFLHLHSDADFAGGTDSKRSTTGIHLMALGPWTCFPINGQSKRQGAVSHSTPEAEIVAADAAIFREGLPTLDLWAVLIGNPEPMLYFHEDNQTMIRIMQTGRNPTMRHLNRTHGVDISAMKEQFDKDNIIIQYTQTDRQCADVHTKAFDCKDKWVHAINNINVFDMHHFDLATVNAVRQLPPADPKEPKEAGATSAPALQEQRSRSQATSCSLGDSPIVASVHMTPTPPGVQEARPHTATIVAAAACDEAQDTYEYSSTLVVHYPPIGQWIRIDTNAHYYCTTELPHNATVPQYITTPEWQQVYRRVTMSLGDQSVLEDISTEDNGWHDMEHMQRMLPAPPVTIATIFYLKVPQQSQLQQTTTNRITHQQQHPHSTVVGTHNAQKQRTEPHVNPPKGDNTADDEGMIDNNPWKNARCTLGDSPIVAGVQAQPTPHGAQEAAQHMHTATSTALHAQAGTARGAQQTLKVKKVRAHAQIPRKGSPNAAGFDAHAAEARTIKARTRLAIPTGISATPPPNTYIRIAPRSGLALMHSLDVAAGVVDADFTGEIQVILVNHSDQDFQVQRGDRIAQLILEQVAVVRECTEVDDIEATSRGEAGFGSTGINNPWKEAPCTLGDSPIVAGVHAQRTHIATSTALHAQAGTAQGTTDTDSQTNTPNNEQPQLPQDKLIPTAANDNGITNDKKTRKRERQQRVREILRGTPFEDPRVKPTRVLVEICCGDDSLLSSGNCKHSDGCLCVRITEKDDFNSDRGVQKILDIIHYFSDIPILLWNTFPCTGGSAYNIHQNWQQGSPSTKAKIAAHWQLFRQFWRTYSQRIAPWLRNNKFNVRQAFELPDTCDYWRWHAGGTCLDGSPQAPIQEFLREHSLTSVICHGCAFDMRAPLGEEAGKLLRKTWRIATNCPHVARSLDNDTSGTDPNNPNLSQRRVCPHGAQAYRIRQGELYSEDGTHAKVRGVNTKQTESYCNAMVDTIHQGFAMFARSAVSTTRPAAPAILIAPYRTQHTHARTVAQHAQEHESRKKDKSSDEKTKAAGQRLREVCSDDPRDVLHLAASSSSSAARPTMLSPLGDSPIWGEHSSPQSCRIPQRHQQGTDDRHRSDVCCPSCHVGGPSHRGTMGSDVSGGKQQQQRSSNNSSIRSQQE